MFVNQDLKKQFYGHVKSGVTLSYSSHFPMTQSILYKNWCLRARGMFSSMGLPPSEFPTATAQSTPFQNPSNGNWRLKLSLAVICFSLWAMHMHSLAYRYHFSPKLQSTALKRNRNMQPSSCCSGSGANNSSGSSQDEQTTS